MTRLDDRLAELLAQRGDVGFDEVMELALYDPDDGFYTSGVGAAGRRGGDFLTSPEVGPLFGAVVARAIGATWEALGRPAGFTVVEAAAGRGALAAAVRAAQPEWWDAATWVLVERSPSLRATQREVLGLDPGTTGRFRQAAGLSGVVAAMAGPTSLTGVVLANELLDNLPVRLVQRHDGAWHELRVVASATGPRVARGAGVPDAVARRLGELAPEAPDAAIVPLAAAARRWVAAAAGLLDRGEIVVVDYGDDTASLASRPSGEWLRTYRGHDRAGDPLRELGAKDITCEVPLDQLDLPSPPQRVGQAAWLRSHGIEDLVDDGRRVWRERAHLGDLTALRARSRVREAEALLDLDGLGAFWVLQWPVDRQRPAPHADERGPEVP